MSHSIRSFLAASTAILFVVPIVNAQGASIIPNNLPACATTCAVLQQAVAACAPTQASGQNAYKSCFCQSAFLAPINTAGTNICAPQCADADFGAISGWFKGFCAAAPAPAAPAPAPGQAPAAAPAPAPAAATPSTSAAATNENAGIDENQSGPQWWSSHWKWVVMLIVLAVGLGLIGILGTIFYRRYKKRREYGDSTAPRPDLHNWAPSQHNVHDFATGPVNPAAAAAATAAMNEKGKGKERPGVTRGRSARGSQRLRKFQA